MSAGHFAEAVQRFQSALRLDPDDSQIRLGLEKAREALAQSRRVAELLAAAKTALLAGDLSGAQHHAAEALRVAPSDDQPSDIMRQVQAALTERDRQRRLSEGVERARRLIDISSWSEAEALLLQLKVEFAANSELADLYAKAQAGKQEKQRQLRLSNGLAAARQQIQLGELSAASERLQFLSTEFPESSELQQLRSFVELERRTRLRHELVERTIHRVQELLLEDKFADARECLEAALSIHSDEPTLQRELHSVDTAAERARRQRSLEEALKSAQDLRVQNCRSEALRALDSFTREYGATQVVEELRLGIETEMEEECRAVELRETIRRANELLSQENVETATEFLRESLTRFQDQPELRHLLDTAETKLSEQRPPQQVTELISATAILVSEGKFEDAIESLDRGLANFPENDALLESRRLAREASDAHKRGQDRDRDQPSATAAPDVPDIEANSGSLGIAARPVSRFRFHHGWLAAGIAAVLIVGATLYKVAPSGSVQTHSSPAEPAPANVDRPQPSNSEPPTAAVSQESKIGPSPLTTSKALPSNGNTRQTPTDDRSAPHPSSVPQLKAARSTPEFSLPVNPTAPPNAAVEDANNKSQQSSILSGGPKTAFPSSPDVPLEASDPLRPRIPSDLSSNTKGATSVDFASKASEANSRGVHFFNLDMYSEAIVNFDEAIRLRPFAEAYFNRGMAYQILGKYPEAIDSYNHALAIKPGYAQALRRKEDAEEKLAAGAQGVATGASPPVLLKLAEPAYTSDAMRAGVRGEVRVECIVDEQGQATHIRALTSPGFGLEEEAIKVVKQATFRPAQKGGKAVPFAVELRVRFHDP